jgi:predicted esterase
LKNLHETKQEKWQFTSFAQLQGVTRRVDKPSEIFLLLHGLGERGKRIFRKLLPYIPQEALIIAPNGPFPLSRNKENKIDLGHSWYFYDKFEEKYLINQDLAKFWLRDLMRIENPTSLPVTIIGFSQGGYLAPLVGKEIAETKLIIGLACEFRATLISEKLPFLMTAIHGENDEIVPIKFAKNEIEVLKKIGINVDFHSVQGGHQFTSEMGELIRKIVGKHGARSL